MFTKDEERFAVWQQLAREVVRHQTAFERAAARVAFGGNAMPEQVAALGMAESNLMAASQVLGFSLDEHRRLLEEVRAAESAHPAEG